MDRVTWWADSTTSKSSEYSSGSSSTGTLSTSSLFTTLDIYNSQSFTNGWSGWGVLPGGGSNSAIDGAQTYNDEEIYTIPSRTLAVTSETTDSKLNAWLTQMRWGGPNAITLCTDSKVGTLDGMQLWYGDYDEVAGPSHGNL